MSTRAQRPQIQRASGKDGKDGEQRRDDEPAAWKERCLRQGHGNHDRSCLAGPEAVKMEIIVPLRQRSARGISP
jgi:hypothetical protein